jgi:hypothetical protein
MAKAIRVALISGGVTLFLGMVVVIFTYFARMVD